MSLNILDRKIPEAIKYASNIITETSDFIPYCKSVYMMLVNSPEFSNIVFNYENLKKITSQLNRKHSKKCTFYTLRFGCSFAAVNTIKPQLL